MKYAALFFLLVFAGCSQTGSDALKVYNNVSVQLLFREHAKPVQPGSSQDFQNRFQGLPGQHPLFRVITAPNYRIFVALPVNTGLDQLTKTYSAMSGQALSYETDDTSFVYVSYEKDGYYVSCLTRRLDGNLLSLFSETQQKNLQDSLFNRASLMNRVQQ